MTPPFITIIITMFFIVSSCASITAEDDVQCLRDFKSSFADPYGHLSSWNFGNTSVGFVCSFTGISCWNLQENRAISIVLSSFNLSGSIPSSLGLCSGITTLNLSSNSLTGTIPPSLCNWLPYLVTLDLSSNSLTGPIPPELSNCIFLNKLQLGSNMLSGSVPSSLSLLQRLQVLDLSNNKLSGNIPTSLSVFVADTFLGNPSLCGYPLFSTCNNNFSFIVVDLLAGCFGFFLALTYSYLVWRFCINTKQITTRQEKVNINKKKMNKKKRRVLFDQLRFFSRSGLVRVTLFQDPVEELMLAELMVATANFHSDNVVSAGSPRLGTSYKATLQDGSFLTVKRLLHKRQPPEEQFRAEIARIGQVRHPNLVPLLGFCFLEEERLLVYKSMANGTLSSLLQSRSEHLDWPTRLRIAIGVARGLAWLHHGSEVPILHQNLSSSVVLLDEDYEPRITDFGLASVLSASMSESSTKTEVYYFGVILLELATGEVNNSDLGEEGFCRYLRDWVLWLSVAGRTCDAIDKSLTGKGHEDKIVELLKVACGCLSPLLEERPSMHQVYLSLKSIGEFPEFSEHYDEFPLSL